MDGLDYLERLKKLGMYSQERRRERYQIIFIWKLSLMSVPPMAIYSAPAARKAREASLQVKGARLFNLVPTEIRNLSGVSFKSGLDAWLTTVPDQPTIPGRQRSSLTNSLIDQVVANHTQF